MSNKSPVFPIPDSQHFSDYGFNYFQVMEEARKHNKRETSTKSSIINSLHFKIQKPISKDDPTRSTMHHNKRKKRWWWKKALPFFKWRKSPISSTVATNEDRMVRNFRAVAGSMSSPVYSTESRTGFGTPYRTTTSRPSSRPIAGTLTPGRKGDLAVPYLSLRELNMEQQQRTSISSSPIYLVT
ncbi:hypothetical protein Bca4012_091294 [Brassica carinata]|uniref:Uncharacterized protein n=3 Tax=Brassica TaxID=3705 RepID=A0A0D3AF88_BRAOL|nr:PREDICTED: uncharacterized protein LOC106296944 [Brassica oleracea var. oleracea]KAG2245764.1 hypothetical protein Bca52824_085392 [Brassica carinata]VDD53194.1 unnamed protein product [Brassica oleracea]